VAGVADDGRNARKDSDSLGNFISVVPQLLPGFWPATASFKLKVLQGMRRWADQEIGSQLSDVIARLRPLRALGTGSEISHHEAVASLVALRFNLLSSKTAHALFSARLTPYSIASCANCGSRRAVDLSPWAEPICSCLLSSYLNTDQGQKLLSSRQHPPPKNRLQQETQVRHLLSEVGLGTTHDDADHLSLLPPEHSGLRCVFKLILGPSATPSLPGRTPQRCRTTSPSIPSRSPKNHPSLWIEPSPLS
jgi:hypothetical protein